MVQVDGIVAGLPHRLRTEWLLLLARRCVVPATARRWVEDRAAPPGPHAPLVWSDEAGSCLLVAWPQDDAGAQGTWHEDERGVTVVRGQLRRDGAGWTDPGRWARDVHERAHAGAGDVSRHDPFAGLVGDGSIVTLSRGGRGVVAVDRSAASWIARGRSDDLVVLGSDARTVAEAVAHGAGPPARDPMAAAWMCHVDTIVGPTTGFVDVDAVPFGTALSIVPGCAPRPFRSDPWLEPVAEAGDASRLVEHVRRTIADHIDASLGLADRPVIEITGGKDSRLVLAVAASSGHLDRVTTSTTGAPGLRDVQIGARIADLLDVPHRSGIEVDAVRVPYGDKARAFVEATGGTVNAWHNRRRRALVPEVRLSGIRGEFLRNVPSEAGWLRTRTLAELRTATPEQLADHVASRGRLPEGRSLLRPEVVDELARVAREDLLADAAVDRAPGDVLATFSLRRNGRTYGGPTLDLDTHHRIWALSHPDALRAAFQLGPERNRDLVHRSLVAAASAELAAVPFADGQTWTSAPVPVPSPPPSIRRGRARRLAGRARRVVRPRRGGTAPTSPPVPSKPQTGGHAPSLVESMQARDDGGIREFLTSCLDDPSNLVWDVADRERTEAALARLDELSAVERKRLSAIATGAHWLAR